MREEGILKRSAGVARRDIERDGAPASKLVRVRVKISPSSFSASVCLLEPGWVDTM